MTKAGFQLWDCTLCEYIHRDEIVYELKLDINERDKHKIKKAWKKLKGFLRE